jgi:FkbM family methyltransferase
MNGFKENFSREIQNCKTVNNFNQFHKVQNAITNNSHQNLALLKWRHKSGLFLKQIGIRKFLDIEKYFPELETVYNKLETTESKALFIKLLAFRKLGYLKVKLPLCRDEFIEGILKMRKLADCTETISPNFLTWKLCKFNLNSIGYNITLFFEPASAFIEFVLKPYEYNKSGVVIKCDVNDTVIDAGGCWGDTALNFASEVGEQGKVYSFEFIPGNVSIMKKNFSLNAELQKRIEIIEHPVWSQSDIKMYCNDFGPASTIQNEYSKSHNIEVTALTIDDFVLRNNISKIDFIKMDIEGAEVNALKGAVETIKKFKPKLAISLYHNLTDFFKIPELVDNLNLGYKFYIDHFTHSAGETVLYAKAD